MFLQNWRANVDLQVIIDVTACAHYMSKYISKSEPHTQTVSDIYESCVSTMQTTVITRSTFCRAMIRAVGERDISSQETAHLLLSLPLYTCIFNFATVSLTGDRQIVRDADSNTLNSIFHYYSI